MSWPVRNECEVIYEMFHILNCGFQRGSPDFFRYRLHSKLIVNFLMYQVGLQELLRLFALHNNCSNLSEIDVSYNAVQSTRMHYFCLLVKVRGLFFFFAGMENQDVAVVKHG